MVEEAPEADAAAEKPIILCVDDEPAYLLMLETSLREEGYEVVTAKSGQEVFELVQETRPDLVLLDVLMPGMSGHEICIRLQANRSFADVPIVFMSGADPDWNKGLALTLGAVAFITKPLKLDEVKREVHRHLQTKKSWESLENTVAEGTNVAPAKAGAQDPMNLDAGLRRHDEEQPPTNRPKKLADLLKEEPERADEQAKPPPEPEPKSEVTIDVAPAKAGAQDPVSLDADLPSGEENASRSVPAADMRPVRRHDEKQPAPAPPPRLVPAPRPLDFPAFKDFLKIRLKLDPEMQERFENITAGRMYEMTASLGIASSQIAKYAAQFMGWDYLSTINPESVQLGVFPASFCRNNQVIAIKHGERDAVILTNPFNTELMSMLSGRFTKFLTTDPVNIVMLIGKEQPEAAANLPLGEALTAPEIADNILESAIYRGASDIHIEPKGGNVVVRFRVDGEMTDVYKVKEDTGRMIISRFKTMAGLDVAEHRRPQDGAMELSVQDRQYVMRLATSSTSYGESLVMRLLEPNAEPKRLQELGMSEAQVRQMLEFSDHKQGLLLIVGATGNGKTTTIYSLLNQMSTGTRSLISVEDPVEYRIKGANQQQVNVKGGVTFEALLKSCVRQDPDILFIGEMRDPQSAKIAVDFSSTGHLTISTLHTSNATTAIFRLERLEMKRPALADAVLGIVAQKLLKKLCTHCRKIGALAPEDAERLKPFVKDLPTQAAYPVGCVKCGDSGYAGREGVYEILKFYPEVITLVRGNAPIGEIRDLVRAKGDDLMSDQAIEKMRRFVFSPKDIFDSVLAEEATAKEAPAAAPTTAARPGEFVGAPAQVPSPQAVIGAPAASAPAQPAKALSGVRVLLVEDSATIQGMIQLTLQDAGAHVTLAGDGVEAMSVLGHARFDLIISDINMPRMDGFKLMEILRSSKIPTPVVFLTAETNEDSEVKSLSMGAADFIVKPIRSELLLVRVKKILRR